MSLRTSPYQPTESFLRVATACPVVVVGAVASNVAAISKQYMQAVELKVSLVVFPELSLTGYTLGDIVHQTTLLEAAEHGLLQLTARTRGHNTA